MGTKKSSKRTHRIKDWFNLTAEDRRWIDEQAPKIDAQIRRNLDPSLRAAKELDGEE